jgi:hypothetical protein
MLAGRFRWPGCPADVSHGAVRVTEVEMIATVSPNGSRASPGDALAATAGTSDSPWRNQRANDSGLRRLTQIGWDRTAGSAPAGELAEPLVPTAVTTNRDRLGNQASELEPRYGIEP